MMLFSLVTVLIYFANLSNCKEVFEIFGKIGVDQKCDLRLFLEPNMTSASTLFANKFSQYVQKFKTVEVQNINSDVISFTPIRQRCIANFLVLTRAEDISEYLRELGSLPNYDKRLPKKEQLFIIISLNISSTLKEAVYFSSTEFQYHANAYYFEFDEKKCLESKSGNCVVKGYYFDTFGTFQPVNFVNFRPFAENALQTKTEDFQLPDILKDMKGYTFIVATLLYAPFIRRNSEGIYSGLEIDLSNFIGEIHNFRYRLINPPDGAWGKPDSETGIWSGLIGHVLYGHANWSMAGIAVNPEREEFIDFAFHFDSEYIDWVTPLPGAIPKWPAIFRPFTLWVWVFVILTAALSGILMRVLDEKSQPDSLSRMGSLLDCYMFTLSALFRDVHVSSQKLPTNESTRIYMTVWWIFTLIINTAYMGNLMAFMTSPGVEAPIDTPERVLESNMPIGMYNYQGATTLAFTGSKNPLYKEMWNRRQWITSFDEAYKDVAAGNSLFLDYRYGHIAAVKAGYLDDLGRSLLHLANYNTFRFGTAWAVQPRSMFKEALSKGTILAMQTGHLHLWTRKTIADMKRDSRGSISISVETTDNTNKPLTLEDLQGPFYAIGFLSSSCLLTFLFETCVGFRVKPYINHTKG